MSWTARLHKTMGESGKDTLRADFDANFRLEFHGSKVSSDGGMIPYRELDDVPGLTETAGRLPLNGSDS